MLKQNESEFSRNMRNDIRKYSKAFPNYHGIVPEAPKKTLGRARVILDSLKDRYEQTDETTNTKLKKHIATIFLLLRGERF